MNLLCEEKKYSNSISERIKTDSGANVVGASLINPEYYVGRGYWFPYNIDNSRCYLLKIIIYTFCTCTCIVSHFFVSRKSIFGCIYGIFFDDFYPCYCYRKEFIHRNIIGSDYNGTDVFLWNRFFRIMDKT